jgi:O-antigen biosynthesis protein WbqP
MSSLFWRRLKRLTDVVLSAAALVPLMPLFLLIALSIKLDSPGPVIYKQKRFGRHGKFFEIYKFRTMRAGTPALPTDEMAKLPSPVTRIGDLLRKSSIDELPQLVNVLAGSMSLVGPRPALFNQVELNEKRKAKGVLEFSPGITGWAQVNGRDELADDVKVELDKWYCDNWRYLLDWQILLKTVAAVFNRRGVN